MTWSVNQMVLNRIISFLWTFNNVGISSNRTNGGLTYLRVFSNTTRTQLLVIFIRPNRSSDSIGSCKYLHDPIGWLESCTYYSKRINNRLQSTALNGMAWGAPNAILELADKLLYDSNYQTPFFNDYDW